MTNLFTHRTLIVIAAAFLLIAACTTESANNPSGVQADVSNSHDVSYYEDIDSIDTRDTTPELPDIHDEITADIEYQDTEFTDAAFTDTELDAGEELISLEDLLAPAEQTGGALTSMSTTWRFMELADGLSLEQMQQFSQGREFFVADWDAAPGSRTLLDGLGPLFHDVSCGSCHPATGRPPTLGNNGQVHPGLLIRLARPQDGGWVADPSFGGQFQPQAIPGVPAEGRVTWSDRAQSPEFRDFPGLIAPEFHLETHAAYSALHADTRAGGRISPQLLGLGLLDLVSDDAILALEDPDDLNGDGISGRVHRLPNGSIGRFGWKATQPTLLAQSAAAFANDMGITSPENPQDDCTSVQTQCLSAPNGGEPEITGPHLSALIEFQRYVGVPAARRTAPESTLKNGATLFRQAGCDSCHVPSLETGDIPAHPLLSNQRFYAFTDLLLHDMGPGLADFIGEGNAAPEEWRTPPLWGIGLVESLSTNARFLHDGRARSIHEAILWHGGEAESARKYVQELGPEDLEDLLIYVRSL